MTQPEPTPPDDEPPPVARGRPIERTDADLDALAAIGDADIDAARDYWQAHAPDRHRELIEAEAEPEEGS